MSALLRLKEATSLEDLAKILGYTPSSLSYIVYRLSSEAKYTSFAILKSGGGERIIHAPTPRLKMLQRRLARLLGECEEELRLQRGGRSLSHAFRRKHSIITNAWPHRGQRYVLNLDLKDFFPSINFGRVRGFFLKSRHFGLNERVATLIAQIACHENSLPQGSPCSPVISNLIGHVLDRRLAGIAKTHKCTYSRYADDITFSTSLKSFPPEIAVEEAGSTGQWRLGSVLRKELDRAGFVPNEAKTRLHLRTSRQMATGLVINKKVNVRAEYYRSVRAMCHSLFHKGAFTLPQRGKASEPVPSTNASGSRGFIQKLSRLLASFLFGKRTSKQIAPESVAPPREARPPSLAQLEGMLNHIYYVKNSSDTRKSVDKRKNPSAAHRLYKQFLFYKHFVALSKPLVICEGKTDSIYLRCTIEQLYIRYPDLIEFTNSRFKHLISYFRYSKSAHDILQLGGGTGDIKFLIQHYASLIKRYSVGKPAHPVIILIDNDDGAKDVCALVHRLTGTTINVSTDEKIYYLSHNLYLIKTPCISGGESCIENFFESTVIAHQLDGKTFNPADSIDPSKHYGKIVFAEKVIRPNAASIKFDGFDPLIARIQAAISDYQLRLTAST